MSTTWVRCRANPSSARPATDHRDGKEPGGSATSRRAPSFSSGAAHSAVGAGGAKLRAVTRSDAPRRAVRATFSARSHKTSTRLAEPSVSRALFSQAALLWLLSTKTHRLLGHVKARTSPGSPPPLPRSTAICGTAVTILAKARLRSIWAVTGPGPRKPNRRASFRSASSTAGS